MEESWQRFRPPQATNICPTCSISHFPFCPRPLPFDHRTSHDPQLSFLDPIANPQHQRIPFPPLPSETRFLTNPNFDRDTLNQFSPIGDSNRRNGLYSPPPHGDRIESIESDRINKRMRVGDMGTGLGPFTPPPPPPPLVPPNPGYNGYNASRLSLEDERRLNLIRDHGAPQSNMPFRDQLRGYPNEISHGDRFEESRGSEWKPSPPTSNYYDPVSRFGERTGSILPQERAFDSEHRCYEEKKEAGFGFEQQTAQRNIGVFQSNVDSGYPRNNEGSGNGNGLFNTQRNEPMQQQSQYGHGSNLGYSHQSYGPSNVLASAPDYVNSSLQGHYSANFVREENRHYMNQVEHSYSNLQKDALIREPHISHNAPTNAPIPPESRENYYGHDPYYLPTKGNNQAEEFKQHHVSNNSHLYSGSDIPNHVNRQSVNFYEQKSGAGQLFEAKHPPLGHMEVSTVHQNPPGQEQFGSTKTNQPGPYLPMSAGNGMVPNGQVQVPANQSYGIPPPLPPLPPPPLPMEPPGPPPPYPQARFSPPKQSSSMHTIPVASSTPPPSLHPSAGQSFTPKIPSPDKPKIIDATCLFKQPFRATRPDHMVIILRGLPGSGKSYLAKMLRDLEVESGAAAPRIHSMDDYFMTEVEKVEESSKSSSSGKGKKRTTKKVMEYCYEPEMEEAYRSSMLKAFKKTLEDGMFTFIIVDDRNLRVADFAQFWASAKRSGYEVYLLEATYKDPAGCAARNVHGFTSDDIKKMAETWEEAPSLYLRLDSQSLFSGDVLKEHGIQEVDMDTEDVACDEATPVLHNAHSMKKVEPPSDDCAIHSFVKDEGRWDAERDPIGVKELGRSKWLDDVDEDIERSDGKGNVNALSGLIQAYSKGETSVHWGDRVGKTGFAIGAAKRENSLSLVIGPGAGYNLKSNPLPEDEDLSATTHNGWESKKRNVFQELNRAEHESFRAVFDRRRQRIGGLGVEEE